MRKRSKLGRQNSLKIDTQGLPDLLMVIQGEALCETVALKLQPSLAKYLDQQGGAPLIRQFIINGLKRALDKPKRAICKECANLNVSRGEDPFCLVLLAYLDKKLIGQVFSCDHFYPKGAKT